MKRKNLTFLAILAAGFYGYAQNSLTVNVSNLATKKGQVEIGLFNTEKNFLKSGAQYLIKKVAVNGNKVSHTFKNLPQGNYAVAVYHDANHNNKCDLNMIGMPVEGYGFSRNFRPKLSAPKFDQTKVYVADSKSIDIQLIN